MNNVFYVINTRYADDLVAVCASRKCIISRGIGQIISGYSAFKIRRDKALLVHAHIEVAQSVSCISMIFF